MGRHSLGGWDWMVKGFDSKGKLIAGTVHKGSHSKDMEVEAWKSRMRNGDDVLSVEVIDLQGDRQTLIITPSGEL